MTSEDTFEKDVQGYGTNVKENRLVIHEFTLRKNTDSAIYDNVEDAKRHIEKL